MNDRYRGLFFGSHFGCTLRRLRKDSLVKPSTVRFYKRRCNKLARRIGKGLCTPPVPTNEEIDQEREFLDAEFYGE
jgi:hypothetical protein